MSIVESMVGDPVLDLPDARVHERRRKNATFAAESTEVEDVVLGRGRTSKASSRDISPQDSRSRRASRFIHAIPFVSPELDAVVLLHESPFAHWLENEDDFRLLGRMLSIHCFTPGQTLPESPFYLVARGTVNLQTDNGMHWPINHEAPSFLVSCNALMDIDRHPVKPSMLSMLCCPDRQHGWDEEEEEGYEDQMDDESTVQLKTVARFPNAITMAERLMRSEMDSEVAAPMALPPPKRRMTPPAISGFAQVGTKASAISGRRKEIGGEATKSDSGISGGRANLTSPDPSVSGGHNLKGGDVSMNGGRANRAKGSTTELSVNGSPNAAYRKLHLGLPTIRRPTTKVIGT